MTDYDVITVGGGLGGAGLAKVLAERGARVLVVEREHVFKDRIRGEWLTPWGAAEIQKLSLYDALLESCANPQPYIDWLGFPMRDLLTTTPHKLPALTFFHPAMQEVVVERAKDAGAEVWRGAEVRGIKAGQAPRATVQVDSMTRELTARLVVCADGRSSVARTWLGFTAHRGRQRLLGAGVMFDKMRAADDTSVFAIDSANARVAVLFPQGRGSARAYLAWPKEQMRRLQGDSDFRRFIAESVSTGHAYAEAHDEYFRSSVKVGGWLFDLFFLRGDEADQVRARAMPLLAAEPDRVPDHNMSGPDLPCDDSVRRRLFGEQ